MKVVGKTAPAHSPGLSHDDHLHAGQPVPKALPLAVFAGINLFPVMENQPTLF